MYEVSEWNFEGNGIRVLIVDKNPWFVGKDVAEVLGYAKPLDALARHVDVDDSVKHGLIDSMGRVQDTILINESGLYSLILSSKLDNAKRFKHWVTREVLPAIRQTGSYSLQNNSIMQLSDMRNYITQLNSRPHFPEHACKLLIQDYFLKHIGFAPALEEIKITEVTSFVEERNGIVEKVRINCYFSIGTYKYYIDISNSGTNPYEFHWNYLTRFDEEGSSYEQLT